MQMSRAKRRLNGPARTFMTSLRRSKAAVWTVDDTCGSFDRMNIHNVSTSWLTTGCKVYTDLDG